MTVTLWESLRDLVILLGAAVALGLLMERLKQSAIAGYLLAGVLLGPYSLDVISNENTVQRLGDLGVTLLLFTIGLEFSWSKLRKLGGFALISGTLQITLTTLAFAALSYSFGLGYGFAGAIAVGAIVSLSSTGVVLPVLQKRAEMDSPHGRFALGVLLIQDAAVVPLVLLLSALSSGGSPVEVMTGGGLSLLLVVAFFVVFFLIAKYILPWLVNFGTKTGNREAPVLFALVTAIGSAYAAQALGLSAALGAFIAGIFLGESVIARQLRGDMAPLRTVFVTLFFAAIGMYANPAWMWANLLLLIGGIVLLVFGKSLVTAAIASSMKLDMRSAVAAGLSTSQIGVFSFVLAQIALGSGGETATDGEQATGIIDQNTFDLIVSVAVVSLLITPYLVAMARPAGLAIERWSARIGLSPKRPATGEDTPAEPMRGHVVIVGFGPAGRAVAEDLDEHDKQVAVIDLNPRLVAMARQRGFVTFVGDATSPDLMAAANVSEAQAVVVTLPDHRLSAEVVHQARVTCPSIPVLARARYSAFTNMLKDAGAHAVVDEEQSVGKAITVSLRRALADAGPAPEKNPPEESSEESDINPSDANSDSEPTPQP